MADNDCVDVISRTFVGIPIPGEASRRIEEGLLLLKRKPGVENIRWSSPSEYLIQMASLGELSPATIGILKQVLPPVVASFPPMRLEIKGFAGTPNLIQPRYTHAEIVEGQRLLEPLAQAIDRAVAPHVLQRDTRGFRPSIVVGRLKTESEPLRVALGRALKMMQPPEMGVIEADAIYLLKSVASEFGVGYDPLERMPLGG